MAWQPRRIRTHRLPEPLRLILLHAALGFGLSTLLVAGVLWTDPGGLARLLLQAPEHPLPVLLLWFFAGLSFGAVQVGVAIIQQGRE